MNHILNLIFLLSVPILLFGTNYTVETIPNVHLQNAQTFVSNPDTILSTSAEKQINILLDSLQAKTSAEVAVVAVNSIGDADIKQFATELFNLWGIGKREKDNGLLILFVLNQRKITFETGYGIEGILPDAICKRIQMQYMLPEFKTGNYDKGMLQGINAIYNRMATPESMDELWTQKEPIQEDWGKAFGYYAIIAFLFSIVLLLMVRSSVKTSKTNDNYQQYKDLSGYKSILLVLSFIFPVFILFIYIWVSIRLKRLRDKPRKCDSCGTVMRKLSEEEDNRYLTPQENTEEKLQSVDYDVWLCDQCGNTKIYPYENRFTKYSKCPQCRTKAYSLSSDRILIAPTSFSTGMGEKTYNCSHCHFQKKSRYVIPMIIVASGNNRRGGGGFSGGSFGGGRSGGGGATSGW
ncbi:TPM domain-containing protein [Coprobacter sp.]